MSRTATRSTRTLLAAVTIGLGTTLLAPPASAFVCAPERSTTCELPSGLSRPAPHKGGHTNPVTVPRTTAPAVEAPDGAADASTADTISGQVLAAPPAPAGRWVPRPGPAPAPAPAVPEPRPAPVADVPAVEVLPAPAIGGTAPQEPGAPAPVPAGPADTDAAVPETSLPQGEVGIAEDGAAQGAQSGTSAGIGSAIPGPAGAAGTRAGADAGERAARPGPAGSMVVRNESDGPLLAVWIGAVTVLLSATATAVVVRKRRAGRTAR